jgi:uncharacterized membrane protein YoaK (UPF0700 family)
MTGLLTVLRGGWLLPLVLSVTAGAVDVIGFLALDGLFTAHITGNLVVLAVHYVTGGVCKVGPLLSVPVFIAVLGVVLLACGRAGKPGHRSRRALLALHAALLAGYLGLGVGFGPFPNADRALAVFVGMLGVAAMATQNALVRLVLTCVPSTAVMTTNITQLAIDLAALAGGRRDPNDLARERCQAGLTSLCVVGFVAGCAVGAALEFRCGLWALALPVVLAVLAVPLGELWDERRAEQTSYGRDQGRIPGGHPVPIG